MSLSIVQRIKLGFALLLLLLLVLGAISYTNTSNIHSKLKRVTDEAAPFTLAISSLREILLSANRDAVSFLGVWESGQLDRYQNAYRQAKGRYDAGIRNMASFHVTDDVKNSLSQSERTAASFFATSEELLRLHTEEVELRSSLLQMRVHFLQLEDTYRSAADLLLHFTSGQRSLQNKGKRPNSPT